MIYIKDVLPKDDYRLEVLLDNGSSVMLNLENRLQTVRFGMLSDKQFLKGRPPMEFASAGTTKSKYHSARFFTWRRNEETMKGELR